MMAEPPVRTEPCSAREARIRLDHARKFAEVAELVASERNLPPSAGVAAALAILAGIAASDAACCKAMGVRLRSANHHDAEKLIAAIPSGGDEAARSLRRLLDQCARTRATWAPRGSARRSRVA